MINKLAIVYPLNIEQIQNSLSYFIDNFQTQQNKQKLLAMLRHNNQINEKIFDESFIMNCIKVCLVTQLKDFIEDQNKLYGPIGQQQIRKHYFKMFTQGIWKNQFQFQQSVVLLTKLITKFFLITFLDIIIDQKFESEIYVILIYTILGAKISIKVFPILQKKYLKHVKVQKYFDIQNKLNLKPRKTLKKTKSRQSFVVYKPGEKEHGLERRSTKLYDYNYLFNLTIDQFKQGLKDNLYAKPVERSSRQKKTLQSFQKQLKQDIQTRRLTNLKISDSIIPKFSNTNYFSDSSQKIKYDNIQNTTFNFGQISSSLHSEITKRNVSSSLTTNKVLKPKQRNMFHSKGFLITKNNTSEQLQNQAKIKYLNEFQINQKQKLNSQQWKLVINKLKQQFSGIKQKIDKSKTNYRGFQYQNLTFRQPFAKQNIIKQKKYDSQHKLLKKQLKWNQQQGQNLANSSYDDQQQKGLTKLSKIECDVKDRKDLIQNQNSVNKQLPEKIIVNKNVLKQMRKNFDSETIKRYQKINYTMFLLPSVKNKEAVSQFIR